MSSLPIGAIAPEYKIAYLDANEGALSDSRAEVILEQPQIVQEPEAFEKPENSIPEIPKIATAPQTSNPTEVERPDDANVAAAVGGATPIHVVQNGETLSHIAARYKMTVAQLCAMNDINNPHMLRVGQTLLLKEEPPQPRTHTVRNGENLSYIAANYGVTVAAIVQLNDMPDVNRLRIGQVLNIPAASSSKLASRNAISSSGYIWPVIGTISSYFNERRGNTRHNGLDVAAPSGRDIKAARAGRVEAAGWMGGYGYAVILDHGEGLKTLYGHASRLLVKKGDRVVQGQVIAKIGSTGNSTGPHLHFEVRINSSFKDPLKYLPRY